MGDTKSVEPSGVEQEHLWAMIRHYDDHRMHVLKFSTTITAGVLTVATTIYVLRYNLEYPQLKDGSFPPSQDLPFTPLLYRTMAALFCLGWGVTSLALVHLYNLQKGSLRYWRLVRMHARSGRDLESLPPVSPGYLAKGLYSPFAESGFAVMGEAALLFAAAAKTSSILVWDSGIQDLTVLGCFAGCGTVYLAVWLALSRRLVSRTGILAGLLRVG